MLAGKKRGMFTESDVSVLHKEWDEALCPICIEHPYNAVLLLCSSHDKGCRPYICDTSSRHSNCLDRYTKSQKDSELSPASLEITEQHAPGNTSALISGVMVPWNPSGGSSRDRSYSYAHNEDVEIAGIELPVAKTGDLSLKCPLCRGDVHGWKVIEEARSYLNMKTRSCSRESCSFVGNYRELRRHARSLHPFDRPTEVDPSRQQAWSHLEHQREHDDIVSAIQSAIPGAVMFGDYVFEDENNDDMLSTEGETASRDFSGPLLTTLFILQMLNHRATADPSRGTSSRNRQSSVRHSSSQRSSVRYPSSQRSSVRYPSSQRSSVRYPSSQRPSVPYPSSQQSSQRHSSSQRSSQRHSSSQRSSQRHSSSQRSSVPYPSSQRSSQRHSPSQQSSRQRSSGQRNLWEENRYSTRNESDDHEEDRSVNNRDSPAHRRRRLTRTRYTRDHYH